MTVYAEILGERHPKQLFSQVLEVSKEQAEVLREPDAGLYFDWGPDSAHYLTHIDRQRSEPLPESVRAIMEEGFSKPTRS